MVDSWVDNHLLLLVPAHSRDLVHNVLIRAPQLVPLLVERLVALPVVHFNPYVLSV
jgi:hypothetical protein